MSQNQRRKIYVRIDRKLTILSSTQARYEPSLRSQCDFIHPPGASVYAPATLPAQVAGLDARARTVDRIMSGLSGAGNQRNTTIGQLYRRA